MSQRNGFGSGFVLGSIVGGVVGGILGTILASRKEQFPQDNNNSVLQEEKAQFNTEENIELARQGLEDKIAQLNLAIDDIRQQLGTVNSNISEAD